MLHFNHKQENLQAEWVKNMHGQPCLTESPIECGYIEFVGRCVTPPRLHAALPCAAPLLGAPAPPPSLLIIITASSHLFSSAAKACKTLLRAGSKIKCHVAFVVVREEEESLLMLCLCVRSRSFSTGIPFSKLWELQREVDLADWHARHISLYYHTVCR